MQWEQKTCSPKYLRSDVKQVSPPYQCVSPCSPSFGHSRECTFPAENQAQVLLAAFRNLISTCWRAVGEAAVLGRVYGRNGRSTAKETQISRSSEKPSVDCVAWKDGFTISAAFCVAVGSKLALITIVVIFIFGDRETSLLLPVSPRNSAERLMLLQREGFHC